MFFINNSYLTSLHTTTCTYILQSAEMLQQQKTLFLVPLERLEKA